MHKISIIEFIFILDAINMPYKIYCDTIIYKSENDKQMKSFIILEMLGN